MALILHPPALNMTAAADENQCDLLVLSLPDDNPDRSAQILVAFPMKNGTHAVFLGIESSIELTLAMNLHQADVIGKGQLIETVKYIVDSDRSEPTISVAATYVQALTLAVDVANNKA